MLELKLINISKRGPSADFYSCHGINNKGSLNMHNTFNMSAKQYINLKKFNPINFMYIL